MSKANLVYNKIECTGPNLAWLADEMNRRSAIGEVDQAWELIKKKLIETANTGSYRLLLPRDEKMFAHFYDDAPNFYLEHLKEIVNEADLKLLIVQPETFSQIEIWITFDDKKGASNVAG